MADTKESKPAAPAKAHDTSRAPAETPASKDTKESKPAAPAKATKFGLPESEFNKLSLREQKQLEMKDKTSSLRRQATKADKADFQLLNNTNAYTIAAMTGFTLDELEERAAALGTTLKGSAAGDGGQ